MNITIENTKTEILKINNIELETIIGGVGNTKVAILLHGFPETNMSWRFQIPKLIEMGYEIYAPNLRGYGNSSKPKGVNNYKIEHLVADISALYDHASKGREVTLIGHDWGAAISWAFAINKLRPLKNLIIMNVPHPQKMAQTLKTKKQMKKSWYMFFFQIPFLPEYLIKKDNAKIIAKVFLGEAKDRTNFTTEIINHYKQNVLIKGNISAMLNYYRAALWALLTSKTGKLPIIKTPTLMIWGEADGALELSMTENYENLVADFTLYTLPNVSHWVQQEAPQKVNEIMEFWLKR